MASLKKRTAILYAKEGKEYIDIVYMTPKSRETQPIRFPFKVYTETNFDKLFEQISTAFCMNCVKGMALCSADMDFPTFAAGYNFRKKFKEFCEKNGVFFFVSTFSSISQFLALKNTKTSVAEGEEILSITATPPEIGIVIGARLRRENGIYKYINNIQTTNLSFNSEWKKRFLNGTNPKKIILVKMVGASLDGLKTVFKDEKPAIMERETFFLFGDAYFEKVLHAMGEKETPYNVEFFSQDTFALHYGSQVVLVGTQHLAVPYEKSVIIDVDPRKCISIYGTSTIPTHKPEFLERIKLSTIKSKKAKITFKLDHSSFYELKLEPYDGDEMSRDGQVKNKRIEKTPIYISFTEPKPIFGKAALEAYGTKPEYVVFDLIKLCSITSADIMNPKWGFRISKESDAIIVTMQTAEGERKSTTEFLMALIFKNILKIIKNNLEEVVDELEIKFDGLVANELLKETFVKGAELKNVKIVFV